MAQEKKDLVKLCMQGIIPELYNSFYEGLPVDSGVRDQLPEPDIEEDSDSDAT